MSRRRAIAITCLSSAVAAAVLVASAPAIAGAEPSTPRSTGPVWATVSAGSSHTCGIRRDRTLWCWGWNVFGQLGLGDTTDRHIPTQVGTDTNWKRVTVGDRHTCGIRTDHTVWCWGSNSTGELGLGNTIDRYTPTQVGTDADWALIDTGYAHTCGIRTDHTLCAGAGTRTASSVSATASTD